MKTCATYFFIFLFLVFGTTGCKQGAKGVNTNQKKITKVEIFQVKLSTFEDHITLPIVVVPFREVNLGLTQGGRVVKIHVDKGDRVQDGMNLLETDDVLLKSAYTVAKANLDFQTNEFSRNEKLFQDRAISPATYDQVKLQLSQAQGAYESAKKQYEDTVLKAPFSGVITSRNVVVGDILGPGTPAFRIIDMSTVKVQAGIPEKYIRDFKIGNNVTISFDAIPGKTFTGKIQFISPEADPTTRTFLTEIHIVNNSNLMMAGIMGNARILRNIQKNALVIPLNAIVDTQRGRMVYIVKSDNTVEERKVTINTGNNSMVEVTAGLNADDRVIVKGQMEVVQGEQVEVVGETTSPVSEVTGQ